MSFGSRARSWMRTALRRSIVEESQQSEWHFHIDARAEDPTYLYNVTPFDPLATAAAVLSMLAVALLSGWWPARAAASLDPMRALRHD